MVNTPDEHEIPDDTPEKNESTENQDSYAAYKKAGGSLSINDFKDVLETPGSRKLIRYAQDAGISHEFKQIWATSIVGALGREIIEIKGTKWLRDEADALYAMQHRNDASPNVEDAVASVATETHEKLLTQESEGFAKYRELQGTLDAKTYMKVLDARYTSVEYAAAEKRIWKYGGSSYSDTVVEMAAKLMTALKNDPRTEDPLWFIQEIHALANRV